MEFDTSIIMQYLLQDTLKIVPVLWLIGVFLKRTPKVPNWIIPWALTGLSVGMAMLLIECSVVGFMQGILAAGLAVFTHQIYTNTVEGIAVSKAKSDKANL